MARLDDYTSKFKHENTETEKVQKKELVPKKRKLTGGRKRRTWLEENVDKNQEKQVTSPKKITYEKLRKNPLLLTDFLYEMVGSKKQRTTKKITLTQIIGSLDISRNSARTAINFLLKNSVIERLSYESGKDGGAIYKISSDVYKELENSRKP